MCLRSQEKKCQASQMHEYLSRSCSLEVVVCHFSIQVHYLGVSVSAFPSEKKRVSEKFLSSLSVSDLDGRVEVYSVSESRLHLHKILILAHLRVPAGLSRVSFKQRNQQDILMSLVTMEN